MNITVLSFSDITNLNWKERKVKEGKLNIHVLNTVSNEMVYLEDIS